MKTFQFLIAGLFVFGSMNISTNAQATASTDASQTEVEEGNRLYTYVKDQIEKIKSSETKDKVAGKVQELFCRESSTLRGRLSIQSLGGSMCKSMHIALLAKNACQNFPGFAETKCNTNINAVIGNKTNSEVLKELAKTDSKRMAKLSYSLACLLSSFIPGVGGVVTAMCALVNEIRG